MNDATFSTLIKVADHYDRMGSMIGYEPCINGHINYTYQVEFDTGVSEPELYIFQKINTYVFKEPEKVMHNIHEVARHVQAGNRSDGCDIITFLFAKNGKNFIRIEDEYWRVCHMVKDSVAFDFVENSRVLYSAGYAFGRFQHVLSDLPMDRLHETIPDFHNTKKRLNDFFAVAAEDPLGRAEALVSEIDFFRQNQDMASKLCNMLEQGELPLRVTHNDTKYNNILMHKETLEPLCVIDLDTVMPGLSVLDFGDAIRFAANTAVEDETDLSKVSLNLEHFTEFAKGYMRACQGALTQVELDHMALGAIVITIELASRFLADHINGDKYFRIHREHHNLDRARCQIQLARDMINRYEEMCKIVQEAAKPGVSDGNNENS